MIVKSVSEALNEQMIDQHDNKLCIVVMAGLSGSGKTTLATSLGRHCHWPVVGKDLLMGKLIEAGAGMPENENGRIAYELLFALAQDLLVRQHLSLIFDTSVHRPFILDGVRRIMHLSDAEMKLIYCTAPSQVRQARLRERAATGLYHSFMLSSVTAAIEDEDEAEYFRHLGDAPRVVIETQRPFDECRRKALEYIQRNEIG